MPGLQDPCVRPQGSSESLGGNPATVSTAKGLSLFPRLLLEEGIGVSESAASHAPLTSWLLMVKVALMPALCRQ